MIMDLRYLIFVIHMGKLDKQTVNKQIFYGYSATGGNNIAMITTSKELVGSNMSINYPTLNDLKTLVDEAIANNYWLVFMTHCDYVGNDMQMIVDLLDYIASKPINIVAPSVGTKEFCSLIQSNNFDNSSVNNICRTYSPSTKLETDPPIKSRDNAINTFAVSGWSIGNGIVFEFNHDVKSTTGWWASQEFGEGQAMQISNGRENGIVPLTYGAIGSEMLHRQR